MRNRQSLRIAAALGTAWLLTILVWAQRPAAPTQQVDISTATPLDRACYYGRLHQVEQFLKMGTHPGDANKSGQTPLDYAIAGGHANIAGYLLANGVSRNDELTRAVSYDNRKVALYLLAHGANPNFREQRIRPLIVVAAMEDKADMVRFLIAHGADVNEKEHDGDTALMAVANGDFSDVAKTLLAHGADVNARDRAGDTALMLVTYNDDLDIVKMLVAHGAQLNLKDGTGWTAWQIAEHIAKKQGVPGEQEIADYLRNHGAK